MFLPVFENVSKHPRFFQEFESLLFSFALHFHILVLSAIISPFKLVLLPKFWNDTSMIHESFMKYRCFETLCFLIINDFQCFHRNHQCFVEESSTNHQRNVNVSKISRVKTLMTINACIEIINVSLMLHRCGIIVSLMNRPVFLMTTLMNHQCYQCVLDWGWQN